MQNRQIRDDLYASVRQALGAMATGLHSAQTVTLAIELVLAGVHRAIADFAEAWNESSPSILFSLPNELQVACLTQLSFSQRVTASHVSRGWRKLLLDTPSLWVTVPWRQRYEVFTTLFETLLSRSGSAPLTLEHFSLRPELHSHLWDPKSQTFTKARGLLQAAMPRIQSLDIGLRTLCTDDPILWQASAPMLETLRVESPQVAIIPELWWTSCFPRLRRLRLSTFCLPSSPDPTNRLEAFEAGMSNYGRPLQSDARHLFLHFPHLVSLHLHGVSDVSLLPNTRPPATLRHIRLETRRPGGVHGDIEPILRFWRAHPLRTMSLNGFPQFSLSDAIEYFASKVAEPWELIAAKPDVTFQGVCDTGPLKLEVSQNLFIPPEHLTLSAQHFRLLRSLTLVGFWIPAFLRAEPNLPTLAALTLSDRIQGEASKCSEVLRDPTCPPLRVPALRRVVFAFDFDVHQDGYPAKQALVFLRTRLLYDTAPLERITLAYGAPSSLLSLAARALCTFAYEVRCEGPADGAVMVIEPERDNVPGPGGTDNNDNDGDLGFLAPLGT